MRRIQESRWQVNLMTGAPNVQTLSKELEAPTDAVAIKRAETANPNQQFVQTQAILLDPQTQAPAGAPSQQQQTTMGRMRGLTPLRALAQPGQQQQQAAESLRYPYSITLPSRFARLLRETSPVEVIERYGQHQIILETKEQLSRFFHRLSRHGDRKGACMVVDGIRSSISG